MNRDTLQQLARDRLLDAEALLSAGRWSAAYYLAGYAVECALKSCLLRHLEKTGELFRDRDYLKLLGDCWTHDFDKLLKLSGLTAVLGPARSVNSALGLYWDVVKAWKETSRYENWTEQQARELYDAVTHTPNGVFSWLQAHW